MNLISVDFGKYHCGVAKFQNGKLLYAMKVTAKTQKKLVEALVELNGSGVWTWVGELPRVRPKQRNTIKGVQSVLKTIELFKEVQKIKMLHVSSWKNSVPKNVHQARFTRALTQSEAKRIEDDHNAFDAVGIGLFYLGRTDKLGMPIKERK